MTTERGNSPERWEVEFDGDYTRLVLTQNGVTYRGPLIYTDMIQMVEQRDALRKEAESKGRKLADMQEETRQDLLKFTNASGPRLDWHEPDEQDIEAEVTGDHLDNAMGDDPDSSEYVVTLVNGSGDKIYVNLATLLAIATYRDRASR